MTFETKLRELNPTISPNSIKVYLQNIRRLYRFYDAEGSIPLTGKWLNSDKVLKQYKALPFNIRRHLSTAAVKAEQVYQSKDAKWFKRMFEDQKEYQDHRNKNKKSETEKEKMLKGGVKDLKKAATEYKRRINSELKREHSMRSLYKYQLYICLRLFVELPFRNDFPTFHVNSPKDNYILWKKRSNAKFVVTQFKNSDKLGPREVTISKTLTAALKTFLKYREGLVKHDFLLTNMNGDKMSKAAFGKAMHKITGDLTGKKLGSRIIRILHASDNAEIIEKSNALTNKLLHTGKQTIQYVRK